MDTNKIGEWAGIVWRLLSKENREMTFEEVMKATGLDERLEKPLNFDPFGHARFAHLFVLYD